jgi:hypothetical protein
VTAPKHIQVHAPHLSPATTAAAPEVIIATPVIAAPASTRGPARNLHPPAVCACRTTEPGQQAVQETQKKQQASSEEKVPR